VSLWRGRSDFEVEAGAEPWGRARRRFPLEAEAEAEPWGWERRRSPPEAKAEAEAWGRTRRSFLLRPMLNLTVVDFARVVGTAARAGRATLFSCQIGQ
jgi:hypothetical protein